MAEINNDIIQDARILWNYHLLHNKLKAADCILVLGSYDLRVAHRGAELFLQGYAPLLIFSGGLGKHTRYLWQQSEAELFAEEARKMGVPDSAILIEPNSTNTGENVLFTKKMVAEMGLSLQTFILVQKPYMERRSYATFMKQWPGKEVMVTSPQISFDNYPTTDVPLSSVIASMVGDMQRIKDYPSLGFQIPQEIPETVSAAYERLVQAGYTRDQIKES